MPSRVMGASRTDAGVHALRQVVSLGTTSSIEAPALMRGLNALLPPTIRVVDSRDAPAGFDARRWAQGKRYAYLIDRGRCADPFLRRYAWHLPRELDAVAMRRALAVVRGKHDFSAFCAAAGRGRSPVCVVRSTRVVSRKSKLVILISADSFLHHMVRNLVGSLVEIGRGVERPEWLALLLDGRDRTSAGPTAPPHGLALVRVMYPGGAMGQPAGQFGPTKAAVPGLLQRTVEAAGDRERAGQGQGETRAAGGSGKANGASRAWLTRFRERS
jgi:tRNA pseudouridine38-40 synthase